MEHTTKSELPNEYMEEIRSRVAWDLAELRRSYYTHNYRGFATISKRIDGYFFLDLISYGAYCRARTMMFNRGLTCV